MFRSFAVAALAALVPVTAVTARPPVFDPAALKPAVPGGPSDLLVIGTAHLSTWPQDFDPAALEGLIARLAAWQPRILAVESVSGVQCAMMRRYPARYAETIADYCWDPALAAKATGLDVPAATQAAGYMLAHWPADPAPGQRRHLAALFLAGGERASALVQWLRLPETERHAGDGLDTALVQLLDRLRTRRNEIEMVAVPLAVRLGLERIVAMDDHSSDAPVDDAQAYGEAISKAWDNDHVRQRQEADDRLMAHIGNADGVLALYRALNAPGEARLVYDSDFGAAIMEDSASHYGRQYVAGWETRNLRMASNIREAMGALPGARTLVIVGASHKFYLEAYLNQMHDIEVTDSETILR